MLIVLILLILLLGGGGTFFGYRQNYYGGGGIGIGGLLLLIIVLWLVFGSPYSAYAADDTTVSAGPVYTWLEPYILTAFGVVFSALMTWALAQLQTRTGIKISDQAKASVQQAATNAAGRILAAQEGNIAAIKIDVHSKLVADEIPKLQQSVGDAINKLGMTPERVGDLIAGKVGVLQAAAATPTAAAGQKIVGSL